jgi:hypothetical protein
VASPEAVKVYFDAVAALVRDQPGAGRYLCDVRDCRARRLTPSELAGLTDSERVVAGFQVPERSVATNWLADQYVAAVEAESKIDRRKGIRVTGARPLDGDTEGRWQVETSTGNHGPFDGVVNALWEGRIHLDARLGLEPQGRWTHRYRLSVFARTETCIDAQSAIVSVGPFGDLKNYTGRDFYLSWYPTGMIAEGCELDPPMLPMLDESARQVIAEEILENLAQYLPVVRLIREKATSLTVAGGWVFAMGHGSLADPASSLHRRDRIGVTRRGTYFSVDTGKYSIAPWLAKQVAEALVGN